MSGELRAFVEESNRIEGIHSVSEQEVEAHQAFFDLPRLTVPAVERFVYAVAGAPIRKRLGMDVRVGKYRPPPGGEVIVRELRQLLDSLRHLGALAYLPPLELHRRYETLHPFMDGNGRSGRAIWAWQKLRLGHDPFALGFLHSWYYETLDGGR